MKKGDPIRDEKGQALPDAEAPKSIWDAANRVGVQMPAPPPRLRKWIPGGSTNRHRFVSSDAAGGIEWACGSGRKPLGRTPVLVQPDGLTLTEQRNLAAVYQCARDDDHGDAREITFFEREDEMDYEWALALPRVKSATQSRWPAVSCGNAASAFSSRPASLRRRSAAGSVHTPAAAHEPASLRPAGWATGRSRPSRKRCPRRRARRRVMPAARPVRRRPTWTRMVQRVGRSARR